MFCSCYCCFCCHCLILVNVLADHVAANNMSARHISELRRDLVPDPDIALLAQLSTAAGITLRYASCWQLYDVLRVRPVGLGCS